MNRKVGKVSAGCKKFRLLQTQERLAPGKDTLERFTNPRDSKTIWPHPIKLRSRIVNILILTQIKGHPEQSAIGPRYVAQVAEVNLTPESIHICTYKSKAIFYTGQRYTYSAHVYNNNDQLKMV